jgi:hypothetical protein
VSQETCPGKLVSFKPLRAKEDKRKLYFNPLALGLRDFLFWQLKMEERKN